MTFDGGRLLDHPESVTEQADSALSPTSANKRSDFASTQSIVFGRDISYIDAVYGFAATLLITVVYAVNVFVLSIPITLLWGAIPGRWCWATLIVLSPVAGILAARSATNDRLASEHGQRTNLHVDQR